MEEQSIKLDKLKRQLSETIQEGRVSCTCSNKAWLDKLTLQMLDGFEELKAGEKTGQSPETRGEEDIEEDIRQEKIFGVCIDVSEERKVYEVIWRANHPFNISGPSMSSQDSKDNLYLSGYIAAFLAAAKMELDTIYIHVKDKEFLERLSAGRFEEEQARKLYKQAKHVLKTTKLRFGTMSDELKDCVEHQCGGPGFYM